MDYELRGEVIKFKPSQHSAEEVADFYNSKHIRAECSISSYGLGLCVAKAYYKGQLTGIEIVHLLNNRGHITVKSLFGHGDNFSSAYAVMEGEHYGFACAHIFHNLLINLQLDANGSISFTKKHIKKGVRSIPDCLKPIEIEVLRPYKWVEYHYGNKFINDGGNIFAKLSDIEVLRNRLNVLAKLPLENYIDISATQGDWFLEWRPHRTQ